MPVVSGSSGRAIAESLAPLLDMEHIELISRRFPDGEGYVRVPSESIESVRSEPVVLVSNTYPDSADGANSVIASGIRTYTKPGGGTVQVYIRCRKKGKTEERGEL